ncbi:uncharacterized protein LOC100576073 [Acyrthosiphon pisum]|uniref:Uncharacterized protein n=1 Tax=Acyrthosiphon pisum TaxID=7029 RepID=A0A8R2AI48_ACYPI|nr:uncharacterized protein LOC100576073 [Acyrthosiphon pisum]|eukprot:XP_003247783.1 PREDICTED: uncharacterized protein LOC100576073 [Acyrthosiphon pisum]
MYQIVVPHEPVIHAVHQIPQSTPRIITPDGRVPNTTDDFPAICVGRCQIPLAAPGLAGRAGVTRVNDVIGKQTNRAGPQIVIKCFSVSLLFNDTIVWPDKSCAESGVRHRQAIVTNS